VLAFHHADRVLQGWKRQWRPSLAGAYGLGQGGQSREEDVFFLLKVR
jgi:hypothetical protein